MWWWAIDHLGEDVYVAIVGLMIGAAFGACAAASKFCIRSAVLSSMDGSTKGPAASWIAALVSAGVAVQSLAAFSLLDLSTARQESTVGSISGAALGGLLLGVGIAVARGCPSRQLVLAAGGNLRAFITLIFVAIGVDLAVRGGFAPLAHWVSALWTIEAAHRAAGQISPLLPLAAILAGVTVSVVGMRRGRLGKEGRTPVCWGGSIGLLVAAAWLFSAVASRQGFVLLYPTGINFAGPVWKIGNIIRAPGPHWYALDSAIVIGVFLGALLLTVLRREFHLVGFTSIRQLLARICGGTLIGFGASLAGGCSIGSLSGASILSITNWLALVALCGGVAAWRILEQALPQGGSQGLSGNVPFASCAIECCKSVRKVGHWIATSLQDLLSASRKLMDSPAGPHWAEQIERHQRNTFEAKSLGQMRAQQIRAAAEFNEYIVRLGYAPKAISSRSVEPAPILERFTSWAIGIKRA